MTGWAFLAALREVLSAYWSPHRGWYATAVDEIQGSIGTGHMWASNNTLRGGWLVPVPREVVHNGGSDVRSDAPCR